jgi:transcriptional regulator with GAF, ATPase, and Fis domain
MQTNNTLALYFSRGGMAYYNLLEGRLKEARNLMAICIKEGASAGLVRQYASPFVLEMLYEFKRHGLDPIPDFDFDREVYRILKEPNLHLRGVALRLRATDSAFRGEDYKKIQSDLLESEDYLKQSGDPIQLAKTRIEMARLKLRVGDKEKASILAQKAFIGFSNYEDVFYPDDLRHLLVVKSRIFPEREPREELLDVFMSMIQDLVPSTDLEKLLTRTVAATNRFFGAERGGIFWFDQDGSKIDLNLRGGYNLSKSDIEAEEFKFNLSLIFKTYRENMPHVVRNLNSSPKNNQSKAILCLPIFVRGRVVGVLYHDNSYIKNCFDIFEKPQLIRIAQSLSSHIEHVIRFTKNLEQKTSPNNGFYLGQTEYNEIITQSPLMFKILDQADRVAPSDSTILISGETGVGKELFAQRIHRLSHRHSGPFVVVEPAAIPEGLVESELFGHEKGAFTGADRQKPGRLELAHRGTLFIDEVSEIPKSVQVKLLRALQEKSFVRLGGTRTLYSDFHLIAATNRNLIEEIAAGRFREDLYYRINVVSIFIPPLRERIEDIPLLAQYFLNRYATKYGYPIPRLTPHDKAKLIEYSWPGNVRELKNLMEKAVLLYNGNKLELNLPHQTKPISSNIYSDYPTLNELQRRYIQYILQKTKGKIGGHDGAAQLLGMKRTTLYNKMKKLGLR